MTGSAMADLGRLAPGFAEPVLDAQATFRAALSAMARPGTVVVLPTLPLAPSPLSPAAGALCLALLDLDTPLWLDAGAEETAAAWLRFHCGCPVVARTEDARFALVTDAGRLPPLDDLAAGSAEAPDRSATLIVQVTGLRTGPGGRRLTGPGIRNEAFLAAEGLPDRFWAEFRRNHDLFPRGIDVFLAAPDRLAALPRTTLVDE